MSVQAITAALALRGTTPSEKLLLIALANYADAAMLCWPAQKTLADDTGLTDRTIRSLLMSLEAKGLLKRKKRFSNGRQVSDLIMLTLRAETISTQMPSISGGGGNPLPFRAETISAKPVNEPSKEPLARDAPPAPDGAARSLAKGKKFPSLIRPTETQAEMAARLRKLA